MFEVWITTFIGWWFGTSRGLNTYQLVRPCHAERWALGCALFAIDLVMDMAPVDIGQVIFVVAGVEVVDPKHERHLLRVVHANCLMTYSGVVDGGSGLVTLFVVIVMKQDPIPMLEIGSDTKVLSRTSHTWNDFLLIDACRGIGGMSHGALSFEWRGGRALSPPKGAW